MNGSPNRSGQVPDVLPPIAGLLTTTPVKQTAAANLYLLCESPTVFSKTVDPNVRQEQTTRLEFHKTFQGIRKVEPILRSTGKVASVARKLARNIMPSRNNPWKKPVPRPVENVISRMINAPSASLKPEPGRRPRIPFYDSSEASSSEEETCGSSPTGTSPPRAAISMELNSDELNPHLTAKYRVNADAERVASIREKNGKLRHTSTFVRKSQAAVMEGHMAYDHNNDDHVILPPIRSVPDEDDLARKRRERGPLGTVGSGSSVSELSSDEEVEEADSRNGHHRRKRSHMVGFKGSQEFGATVIELGATQVFGNPADSHRSPADSSHNSHDLLAASSRRRGNKSHHRGGGGHVPRGSIASPVGLNTTTTSMTKSNSKKYLQSSNNGHTSSLDVGETSSYVMESQANMTKEQILHALVANHSRSELEKFESVVDEKRALEAFMQPRPRTIPNMMINQFRHHLAAEGDLVSSLRKTPLKVIEKAVMDIRGSRAMTLLGFNSFLNKVLGENNFSKVESQQAFCYFDTDGDGDLDEKELCNGLILALSLDGPLVTVLHRCQSMVRPRTRARDTRILSLSRFELVMMSEAIVHATKHYDNKEESPNQEVVAELQKLLQSFQTDTKGQFQFDKVKEYLLGVDVLIRALDSFTVPREKHLFDSFLSQYYRTTDSEEGETAFRLMHTERTDRRVAQEVEKKEITTGTKLIDPLSPTSTPASTPANQNTKGRADAVKRALSPTDVSLTLDPLEGGSADGDPTRRSSLALSDHSNGSVLPSGIQPPSSLLEAALTPSSRQLQLQSGLTPRAYAAKKKLQEMVVTRKRSVPRHQEKVVTEPGEPKYFTLKGVLMRQLEGEREASRFWLPEMGNHVVKYTGDRKSSTY